MINIEDIVKILLDLGGCDAKEEYAKGWDDAIDAVEYEIVKLMNGNIK